MAKLDYIRIPIEQLRKADWNYKTEDKELSKKLKQNILLNGQIENIIVREIAKNTYEIVNGNHRYDVFIDPDVDIKNPMCYNLGQIPITDAQKIALETNETKFGINSNKLNEVFMQLTKEYDSNVLAQTLNYDEDYIKLMSGQDEIVADIEPLPMPDLPIMDNHIQELEPPKTKNESFSLRVGNHISEIIEDHEVEDLYDAFDKIKQHTNANCFVQAIIALAEEI